jgi:xanthine dehydrogenase/oxidase
VLELTKSYKQAKRKDDDIAIVNAGFRVRLDNSGIVEDVALAYGGMAPVTVLATECAKFLIGKQWKSSQTLQEALSILEQTFRLSYGVPGGMATYRRTLALSMFFRFWHEVIKDMKLGDVDPGLVEEIHRSVSFGARDNYNPHEQRVVGKQVPHLSGLKHATGEAEYLDDMPHQDHELYCAMVLSQRAHAIIKSVDWSPALKPGLAIGYIDKNSIDPNKNNWGSVVSDEPWFATDKVYSHGQPIGMVYAETALKAQEAARAVEVEYEDLKPILTIDEAIEAESFYTYGKELRKGAPPEEMGQTFAKCDRVFEGVIRVGGQEHFYLETNAAMVIPHVEDNSMEVWSSTQNT